MASSRLTAQVRPFKMFLRVYTPLGACGRCTHTRGKAGSPIVETKGLPRVAPFSLFMRSVMRKKTIRVLTGLALILGLLSVVPMLSAQAPGFLGQTRPAGFLRVGAPGPLRPNDAAFFAGQNQGQANQGNQ